MAPCGAGARWRLVLFALVLHACSCAAFLLRRTAADGGAFSVPDSESRARAPLIPQLPRLTRRSVSLQGLPACTLPSLANLPPNLPIGADGTFSINNIILQGTQCQFFSLPLNVDSQFFLGISSSPAAELHVWRREAPLEASWDSRVFTDASGSSQQTFTYVQALPNGAAMNSSATSACNGRSCTYLLSVSVAAGASYATTSLQGGIGTRLAYGAAPVVSSVTAAQVRFYAVDARAADLPIQVALVPSSTSSISVAVDQYILPLDKPFVQVYPHANNMLPVRYPATLNAYISNDPGYYADGLFLIQVITSPYVRSASTAYSFSIAATRAYAGTVPSWVPTSPSTTTGTTPYSPWVGPTSGDMSDMVRSTMLIAVGTLAGLLFLYMCLAYARYRAMQHAAQAMRDAADDADDGAGDDDDIAELDDAENDYRLGLDDAARAARQARRVRRQQRRAAEAARRARATSREFLASLPTMVYTQSRSLAVAARASVAAADGNGGGDECKAPELALDIGSGGATAATPTCDEQDDCAICMGEYVPGEVLRVLPCAHFFHLECIDQWLGTSKLCPLCQQNVEAAVNVHGAASACRPGPASPAAARSALASAAARCASAAERDAIGDAVGDHDDDYPEQHGEPEGGGGGVAGAAGPAVYFAAVRHERHDNVSDSDDGDDDDDDDDQGGRAAAYAYQEPPPPPSTDAEWSSSPAPLPMTLAGAATLLTASARGNFFALASSTSSSSAASSSGSSSLTSSLRLTANPLFASASRVAPAPTSANIGDAGDVEMSDSGGAPSRYAIGAMLFAPAAMAAAASTRSASASPLPPPF